ncbi:MULTISPECIES: methyltransferase [unclassified Bradyrhizobium]|uniref:methyltransferase n=1 Tax=unclassified Bradyrhizobium TaxID=2631580 RepID=UPI002FF0145B
MTDRIETAGGNFFEQLPGDHDVHLLSMILHDWDEAKNRALLRVLRGFAERRSRHQRASRQ